MSKRLDVIEAVKALIAAALPGPDVVGLAGDDAAPARIGPLGRVVVRSGDPGDPEVCLSPLTYWYEHPIPIEVSAYETTGLTSEQVIDAMLAKIGAAIDADRTLGGLCEWLQPTAPTTEDLFVEGNNAPPKAADLLIVATYSTINPLT